MKKEEILKWLGRALAVALSALCLTLLIDKSAQINTVAKIFIFLGFCAAFSGVCFLTVKYGGIKTNLEIVISAGAFALTAVIYFIEFFLADVRAFADWTFFISSLVAIGLALNILIAYCLTLLARGAKDGDFSRSVGKKLAPFSVYFLVTFSLCKIIGAVYGYAEYISPLVVVVLAAAVLLVFPYVSRLPNMIKQMKAWEILVCAVIILVITFQCFAEFFFMGVGKTDVQFVDIASFALALIVVAVPVLEIALLFDRLTEKRFGGER